MRLFELLTEAPPVIKQSKGRAPNKPKDIPMGGGAYASVLGHDDNPHEVMKISHQAQHYMSRDGYEAFVKGLAENNMHDNPYLPRVRTLRTITDDHGSVSYQARIERLTHLSELSEEQAETLVRKSLSPQFIKDDIKTQTANTGGWLWFRVLRSWLSILDRFSKEIPSSIYSTIKDSDLKGALMFVNDLAQEGNFMIDLQKSNFMARVSPYGTQLVITDPLGSQRYV